MSRYKAISIISRARLREWRHLRESGSQLLGELADASGQRVGGVRDGIRRKSRLRSRQKARKRKRMTCELHLQGQLCSTREMSAPAPQ